MALGAHVIITRPRLAKLVINIKRRNRPGASSGVAIRAIRQIGLSSDSN